MCARLLRLNRPCMSSIAPCKVADRLPLGIVLGRDGQGLRGLRPGCARVTWLGLPGRGGAEAVPGAAVRARLPVGADLHALDRLAEHVGGQRFGAHAEVKGLLRRHDADGAAPLEPAVEGELGRENGGERDQDERDDERDARARGAVRRDALGSAARRSSGHLDQPLHASPVLELDGDLDRHRPRPQSLGLGQDWPAATGSARSGCRRGSATARSSRRRTDLESAVWCASTVSSARGVAALQHIVDQRVGHPLQCAALLAGRVRPAGARELRERQGGGARAAAQRRLKSGVRVEMLRVELLSEVRAERAAAAERCVADARARAVARKAVQGGYARSARADRAPDAAPSARNP